MGPCLGVLFGDAPYSGPRAPDIVQQTPFRKTRSGDHFHRTLSNGPQRADRLHGTPSAALGQGTNPRNPLQGIFSRRPSVGNPIQRPGSMGPAQRDLIQDTFLQGNLSRVLPQETPTRRPTSGDPPGAPIHMPRST
jgi:hypothetical protein